MKNLINFHTSSRKSENLHFDELILSKAYEVLDKKMRKSYVLWHWRVMQNLKKNGLFGSSDMRNLLNLNANSNKSENLHFGMLLLLKVYYVWVHKVQKSYMS